MTSVRYLNHFWIPVFGIVVLDLCILPFLPWWSLVIHAFLFGKIYTSASKAFFAAGLGGTIAWGMMILFRFQTGGELIIRRVTDMMGVNSPWILILITLLIPMIISGLAGVCGMMSFGRKISMEDT